MTNYISSFRINDSHPEDFNLFEHPESNWDETEIDKIESKLSDPGLTAEHRIKFIESYLKDEQLIKHNIRGTLLDKAARYFRYNLYQEKKPRLNEVFFNELSEKEQKEYNDCYNDFYKSIETEIDKIGILEYYKNNRDEFYPDKYILKGNIKILECLFKHWNILNITATKETPRKKEPIQEYKLEFNDKMKSDLKKLCNANLATWDGIGKPDFNSKIILVTLIDLWKETYFDIEMFHSQKVKHPLINDNFLINGKTPKIKTAYYTGKEYLEKNNDIRIHLKKIINN